MTESRPLSYACIPALADEGVTPRRGARSESESNSDSESGAVVVQDKKRKDVISNNPKDQARKGDGDDENDAMDCVDDARLFPTSHPLNA